MIIKMGKSFVNMEFCTNITIIDKGCKFFLATRTADNCYFETEPNTFESYEHAEITVIKILGAMQSEYAFNYSLIAYDCYDIVKIAKETLRYVK